MHPLIHVLIVEGSKYCSDLNVRELRRDGFDVLWKQVETEKAMCELLEKEHWDVILADHSTPHFNSIQALMARNRLAPKTPFLIVSEDVSPEILRFAMQNGCCAYLLKENLHQLAILVRKMTDISREEEENAHYGQRENH